MTTGMASLPPGTSVAKRLAVYTEHFDTVELNASFYRWPRDSTFAGWRRRLPDGFLLSVKAARGLTHAKRLLEPEVWVARMETGWRELGDRRAVLLVQLGPGQERDDARLTYFLDQIPTGMRVAMNSGTSAGTTRESSRSCNGTTPRTAS